MITAVNTTAKTIELFRRRHEHPTLAVVEEAVLFVLPYLLEVFIFIGFVIVVVVVVFGEINFHYE